MMLATRRERTQPLRIWCLAPKSRKSVSGEGSGEDDAQVADVGAGGAGDEAGVAGGVPGGGIVRRERRLAALGAVAVEEGAGGVAGAVDAVGVGGEAAYAVVAGQREGGGEGIFLVGAAPPLAAHGDGELAAGDEGGARPGRERESDMVVGNVARLAFAFEQAHLVAEAASFKRGRLERIGSA